MLPRKGETQPFTCEEYATQFMRWRHFAGRSTVLTAKDTKSETLMSWISEARTFSKACFSGIADLLYPPKCSLCYELGRPPICTDCVITLRALPIGSCERCSIDDAGSHQVCEWMSAVDVIRAAFDYRGSAGDAVKRLKFSRAVELAGPMANYMKSSADQLTFDCAVPVPIHWSRKSHRGFNQAELLARRAGLPVRTGLLKRVRATWPQARSSGHIRRSALEGAFQSKPCPGARILLVDDVITSGGTVEACAQELKAKGASWVGAISFALELPSTFRPD